MLIAFLASTGLQLFFWGYFLRNSLKVPPLVMAEHQPPAPVSVIVCFRNEAGTLNTCLRGILDQEFAGEFEVLAVDDNSTDNSASVVKNLAEQDDRLRLLTPGPTRPGKKDALTFGIQHALHEHLLLTDADCIPATKNWLQRMTAPLRRGAAVALGCGLYAPTKSHLSVWQSFEAKYVLFKYMGFARRGLPYMGVGRNLAYTKTFFHNAGGLEAHADLPGGDDDLLIGGAALPQSTFRVTHPDAITESAPAKTWGEFFRQRMRHQSVGFRYRPVHQLLLGLLALSHGMFYLLGLFLLFTSWRWIALGSYVIRFLLVRSVFNQANQVGAAAGARGGFVSKVLPLSRHIIFDALLAPFYLFLALGGSLPAKRW